MLIVSPSTVTAIAPHASETSWVMFVQSNPPTSLGPIKIEAVEGRHMAQRFRAIAADNPFETMLIGLIATEVPTQLAEQICAQFIESHLHDGWFEMTSQLVAFVQTFGQAGLQALLGQTSAGGLSTTPIGIEEIADLLNVSVSTIRRMMSANEIPYLRSGRMLRFVPADVFASLRRR